jgi:hypothetical protein
LAKRGGFFLVELMLVVCIMGMFFASSFFGVSRFLTSFLLSSQTIQSYQFLHYARALAMATDEDNFCEIQAKELRLCSGQRQDVLLKKMAIAGELQTVLSRKIGFKASGNTRIAGSVTLGNKVKEKKVSLGVAYGRVRLVRN